MDDFTFCGRDIREFGASAAFGSAMRTGAKIRRGEYALPGGGRIELGGMTLEPTTRMVTIVPTDGVTADERWRREILAWLQAGRGEMTVHNDPGVIRIAQFDGEATFGTQAWPHGALQLTMTLQPLAYDALTAQTSGATGEGTLTLAMPAQSGFPAPLRIALRVTAGTVTAARLTAGGRTLQLAGMQLAPGQLLISDSGEFLGDVIGLTIDGTTDFSPLADGRWARLEAGPGEAIGIALEGGEATVTVSCRGRWPA